MAHSSVACAISYIASILSQLFIQVLNTESQCLVKTPGFAPGSSQALTLFAVNGVVSVFITSIVQVRYITVVTL